MSEMTLPLNAGDHELCGIEGRPGHKAALVVEDLSVGYRRKDGGVSLVAAAVDLELYPGEVLGLAGESGCGKSTAALASVGYRHPGGVVLSGRALLGNTDDLLSLPHATLRGLWGGRVAYISQNAATSLNPAMSIGHHFDEVLQRHVGLSRSEMAARELELLESVGIPRPKSAIARYPHQLSGGQQQRVALALAFACCPSVLILDEPTTGLDVTTQARITALLKNLIDETQVAVMYVSHDLALLSTIASSIAVMYAGEIVERGPVDALVGAPHHPYTHALLRSVPSAHAPQAVAGIPGEPPVSVVQDSCAFAPRCTFASERCRAEHPDARSLVPDRVTRCLRAEEIIDDLSMVSTADGGWFDDSETSKAAAGRLLEVNAVSCFYGARQRRVGVVEDVSFSLSEAEILGIVGLSGSGKSTLLRAIVGIQEDMSGDILFRGQPLPRRAVKRSRALRKQVQIVFQDPASSLNPRHTVNQIIARSVRMFREDVPRAQIDDAVAGLLESVKLSRSFLSRYPSELSGGQQQRVAIARAFAARPTLLLCDEVTSALDVSVAATIIELLRDLTSNSQTAVIFVSHDLAVVRTLADRAIVMRDGRQCEAGSTEQLFNRPKHPYTVELLASVPDIADVRKGAGLAPARRST